MSIKGRKVPGFAILRIAGLPVRVKPDLGKKVWEIAEELKITPDEAATKLVVGQVRKLKARPV
jgi:DNA-binding LacI/PurR family transcriptional regulator